MRRTALKALDKRPVARRRAIAAIALFVAVIVCYSYRTELFGLNQPVRIAAVVALVLLGSALTQAAPHALQPMLTKRLDPAAAGTVGFLLRLAAIAVVLLVCLRVAGVNYTALAAGGAVTAVILALAAQQTIGNMIAGAVLLASGAFAIGSQVRMRSSTYNVIEGTVQSVGLLYTAIAVAHPSGEQVLVPNAAVAQSTVSSPAARSPVTLRVRLAGTVKPSEVAYALEQAVGDYVTSIRVRLAEVGPEGAVVWVEAVPQPSVDGQMLDDLLSACLTEVALAAN